jgi:hypothetical protein
VYSLTCSFAKLGNDFVWFNFKRRAYFNEFHHVEPALTAFVFCYEFHAQQQAAHESAHILGYVMISPCGDIKSHSGISHFGIMRLLNVKPNAELKGELRSSESSEQRERL